MARWYARFDSGSENALDNSNSPEGYFQKLRIGASSASGAQLRDGLIASRSLLSTDVYDDLDAANEDGGKGIFFPLDSASINISSNFVSWSTAFTSSVEGIKIPTTNTYGVADSINYSKRPTASISYSQSALIIPTNPIDPIGVSYRTYFSASSAVRTVINSIQTGAGTTTTPYTRPGTDPSRTIYSIWHNPTLDYFAWDDFTPDISGIVTQSIGPSAPTGCPLVINLGNPVNIDLEVYVDIGPYKYPNDGNFSAGIDFTVLITTASNGTDIARLQLGGSGDVTPYLHGGPLLIGDYTTGNGPLGNRNTAVSSSWSWNLSGPNYNGQLKWTISLTEGVYNLQSFSTVHDQIITSHVSSTVCTNFPSDFCSNSGQFTIQAGEPS